MAESFIISPAGYIGEYNVSSQMTNAYIPMQNQALVVPSVGQYSLTLGGQRGTLEATIVAGATGSARAVAFLVENGDAPTRFLGIGLDTSNRPTAFIHNTLGTLVGVFAGSGAAFAVGTVMKLRLAWDSAAMVNVAGSQFASIKVNGVLATGTWSTDPNAAWVPFVPSALHVGSVGNSSFQSLSPANATFTRVEVASSVQ